MIEMFVLQKNRTEWQLREYKCCYLSFYSVYLMLEVVALFFWIKLGYSHSEYVMLSLSLLLLFWQILKRPYLGFVNNLSMICNTLPAVLFQVFLMLRKMGVLEQTQSRDTLACFVLAGLIGFCELLSILRIILVLGGNDFKKTE